MPEPLSEDTRAAQAGGFIGHLIGLFSAQLAYFKARFQLAALEGKDAALHYAIILAMAVAALVVVVFGYFFLVLALIFLIAWALDGGNAWIGVMLGAALVHFGAAAALVFVAKGKITTPMFSATLQEFKKDQEWLTQPARLS